MSEWYDSQKKPRGDFRKLLQERIDNANPRRTELTKDEERRLGKLGDTATRLKCREDLQNRQPKTCLTEDEYAQIEGEWQEQLELREELKDKPSEQKRYKKTAQGNKVSLQSSRRLQQQRQTHYSRKVLVTE